MTYQSEVLNMITGKRLSYCLLAGAIRFFLMNSEFQKIISDRVEVSTALNSWKRGNINIKNIYVNLYPICLTF